MPIEVGGSQPSNTVDTPIKREIINYEGLMNAKKEYTQRFQQEKNYSFDKLRYDMGNKEYPLSVPEMLNTIVNNLRFDKMEGKLIFIKDSSRMPKWIQDLKENPNSSNAALALRGLHAKMFSSKGLMNEHKIRGDRGLFYVICNLNSAFDMKPYLDKMAAYDEPEQGVQYEVWYTQDISTRDRKRTPEKTVTKTPEPIKTPDKPIPKIEKKLEQLHVNERWNHNEALVNPCVLAQDKINAIYKGFDTGNLLRMKIDASVDYRMVRERAWPQIDKMFDDAEAFMNKSIGGKKIFEKQWSSLLAKTSLFRELQRSGGAERNKELLIVRAVASIKEVYEKVMTPYLKNKSVAENRNFSQTAQERDRLISMIQIGELKVGQRTTKDLQQDRYTSFDA